MKTLLSDTPGASFARALGRQLRWRHAVRRSFAPPIGDRRSLASPKGAKRCLPPACPPRSHHNSLFTLQSTPAAVARRGVAQASPNVAHALAFRRPRRWRLAVQLGCTGRPAKPRFAGGGGERIRTDDLLLAKQALSQLSYTPGQRSENTTQRSDLFSDLRHLISGWWAREDLNLRPHAYQARALTS
jgi:hypothetical protein